MFKVLQKAQLMPAHAVGVRACVCVWGGGFNLEIIHPLSVLMVLVHVTGVTKSPAYAGA